MDGYKEIESFIADITDSEFFKDHPNIINRASIYRWVSLALKQFGLNIMQKKSTVVEIENYRGYLPQDFGKLSLAVFCEKHGYRIGGDKQTCEKSFVYKDKVLSGYFPTADINDQTGCGDNCNDNDAECQEIVERYEVADDSYIDFYYNNPIYVSVSRDVIHDACVGDCVNKYVQDKVFSINIKGTTIYARFKGGSLYVEYYAIPADEEGNPVIPETDNGYLESYIEYHVKRRILEDSILSQDTQNRFTIFQFFEQKEQELEGKAQRDVSPFTLESFWKAIEKRRADVAKFNINLGNRYEIYPRHYRGRNPNTYYGGNSFGRGQSTTYIKK